MTDNVTRLERPGEPRGPHNLELERALLGLLLINNDAYYRVSQFLADRHFFSLLHQEIYSKAAQLIAAGKPASAIVLKTFISQPNYLDQLCTEAASIINATEYGNMIWEFGRARELIALAEKIAQGAGRIGVDTTTQFQVDEAERALFALAEKNKYGQGWITFSQAVTGALERAAKAFERDGGLSGLATGLIDLDNYMGGLQPSDLIILAGRPGMGKTALATNIAYNIARAWRGEAQPDGRLKTVNGGIVGFYTLEMSAEQLTTRIVSEQSGIPSTRIRRGKIDTNDFERIKDIACEIQNVPFYLDECGALSVTQIGARARRLKHTHGLDLLVIDYLQLLTGTSRRSAENRVNEITEITMRLKALAKELSVPILALAQLSRAVESREDKRPQLHDLRESGSIEQDADVVLFVFREEYYHQQREPDRAKLDQYAAWMAEADRVTGKAELIIAKQRHGPTGNVKLQFDAKVTRFGNLAKE